MEKLVFLFILAFAGAEVVYFITGNDNLDVDPIIGNVTLLQTYVDCFLDKGPCSELQESYKRNMVESVEGICNRCSPSQKKMFRRFLDGLKKVLPKEYEKFKLKYDPKNQYFDALEEELAKFI
ncbi:unnamed protein product, partial [Brenthis ino]